MMDGKQFTQQWIEENKIRDASGRMHVPHGIWTSQARLTVYVAFDDKPGLGRRCWYFFTHQLQQLARDKWHFHEPIRYGSTELSSVQLTGAGYLFSPKEPPSGVSTWIDRVEPIDDGVVTADDHDAAVTVIRQQLLRRSKIAACRRADLAEDREGKDLIVSDPVKRYGADPFAVEVKSRRRHQALVAFFLQVSETNPDRIF